MHKPRGRRIRANLASTVAVAALAALVGCSEDGSDGGDGGRTAVSPTADPTEATSDGVTVIQPGEPGEEAATGSAAPVEVPEPNHSDIAFMQMMVPHHAQALDMADLARRHASSPAVRRLAARIHGSQSPEILSMAAWLEQHSLDVPQPGDDPAEFDHGSHGHDPMMGMMTPAQMAALAAARGAEFDRLFLEGMIRHHQGAVDMAETVAGQGVDVRVQELAADVHAGQIAEIARMQALLR